MNTGLRRSVSRFCLRRKRPTRLPVTESGGVAAVLHANRLLAYPGAATEGDRVEHLGSEPLRIEANMPLDEALERLRANREQMAVVERDGDWVGIVTVEDLLEQIVGGIEDEFD